MGGATKTPLGPKHQGAGGSQPSLGPSNMPPLVAAKTREPTRRSAASRACMSALAKEPGNQASNQNGRRNHGRTNPIPNYPRNQSPEVSYGGACASKHDARGALGATAHRRRFAAPETQISTLPLAT